MMPFPSITEMMAVASGSYFLVHISDLMGTAPKISGIVRQAPPCHEWIYPINRVLRPSHQEQRKVFKFVRSISWHPPHSSSFCASEPENGHALIDLVSRPVTATTYFSTNSATWHCHCRKHESYTVQGRVPGAHRLGVGPEQTRVRQTPRELRAQNELCSTAYDTVYNKC